MRQALVGLVLLGLIDGLIFFLFEHLRMRQALVDGFGDWFGLISTDLATGRERSGGPTNSLDSVLI